MATKRAGRAVWGWMFFDWASQPFHTLILTFTFAPYFASAVAESAVRGQELWGYAMAAGAGVIAVAAPVAGAAVDVSGPRRPWIFWFSLLYVFAAAGLWFAPPEGANMVFVLSCATLALIGVEMAFVFVNSLLPFTGPKEALGRISGSAWAMGYWGGLMSLAIVLCFMTPTPGGRLTLLGMEPVFGLDPELGEGARATGPLSALWYALFMIPFFLWAADAPARGAVAVGAAARGGFQRLWRTVRALPETPSLFAYLISSMFYRDALNGFFAFGGIYAAGVLGWGAFDMGVFGIVAALAGAIGAWFGGRMDSRFGPKPVIVFTILVLVLVSLVVLSTGRNEVFFIPFEEDSHSFSMSSLAFLICGAMIGAAGGALQSASRTMMTLLAPADRMTEAFGLYALAGRATGFLAPLMVAIVTGATGHQRAGFVPLILLLVAGFALMRHVSLVKSE